MQLLTTLLLKDAVEKEGPGSGPHPSAHQAGAKARAATSSAKTLSDHKESAALHTKAAAAYKTLGAQHPKGSSASRLAHANAKYHEDAALHHTITADGSVGSGKPARESVSA